VSAVLEGPGEVAAALPADVPPCSRGRVSLYIIIYNDIQLQLCIYVDRERERERDREKDGSGAAGASITEHPAPCAARGQGLELRVSGFGFRVSGFGFRVEGGPGVAGRPPRRRRKCREAHSEEHGARPCVFSSLLLSRLEFSDTKVYAP